MFPRDVFETWTGVPTQYIHADGARLIGSKDNTLGYSLIPE
jgi:hypothetical protein